MGVIKKVLFRGEILGKPRHRNLFLDMEENIHIHYRDLRIELSRAEFEDIARIFAAQSQELQAIIEQKKYQDGKLPNANQEDVRIWTNSKLPNDVKYHPQRLSLEECGDGYHFHYRNLKLLIDKDEFRQLATLFRGLDLDLSYASTYAEVYDLLGANDVDFGLDAGNAPGEHLAIAVAQHHLPKVRDIFGYIGFKAEADPSGARRYRGERLLVSVRPEKKRSALEYRRLRGMNSIGRAVDYLSRHGAARLDPDEVNTIKCQVLNLYYSVSAGKVRDADIDPQSWLYSPANRQVIFPVRAAGAPPDKAAAERMYRAWADILNGLQLGFVKPGKVNLAVADQAALKLRVEDTLWREVASYAAVDRIWLMGSALRGDMGHYNAPFIHGKLAKLGSDIDILIEVNPALEADFPGAWRLHLAKSSNHCAVYHVAEIDMAGGIGDWKKRYPATRFIQHLVDAYVHFPSRGFGAEKDAFLKKFGAHLFYDRARDGIVFHSEVEQRIAARLADLHGYKDVAVEPMKASTENAVFSVHAAGRSCVLKLFKVSGNYRSIRVAEHVEYEEKLIAQLRKRGIPTAEVLPPKGGADTTIEGFPALLFERIPGVGQQRPEYPLDRICAALAQIHAVQIKRALSVQKTFPFDDACMIWLLAFEDYLKNKKHGPEIAQAFAGLAPIAAWCFPGETRTALFARSPLVHNHGDVTPKNVIAGDSGKPRFFDFNNAFYGPRMADVVDGAFEFSLAEKYIHLADFSRLESFISLYSANCALSAGEEADLPRWIDLIGIIKFSKEVRVMLERPTENLRRKRALAIAEFLISRPRAA